MLQRHRRCRAGDTGHVVVLGHPVARVAQRLRMTGKIRRVAQCLAGAAAFGNGRKIENGKREHAPHIGRDTLSTKVSACKSTYRSTTATPACRTASMCA